CNLVSTRPSVILQLHLQLTSLQFSGETALVQVREPVNQFPTRRQFSTVPTGSTARPRRQCQGSGGPPCGPCPRPGRSPPPTPSRAARPGDPCRCPTAAARPPRSG